MASLQDNSALLNDDNLQISSSQVVLIYTEWNTEIIAELLLGAKQILSQFPQITVLEVCVPGAIEIPFAISQYHQHKPADAYIALGCVIKGETPHFNYVCKSITDGITQLNLKLNSPVIFGILTVHNEGQAKSRLGGKDGHKGKEAAMAALKMMSFKNALKL